MMLTLVMILSTMISFHPKVKSLIVNLNNYVFYAFYRQRIFPKDPIMMELKPKNECLVNV